MSNLQILNSAIRQSNSLYCLNDLHQVSGGNKTHQPSNFIRLDQTQELIAEFEKQTNTTALKTLRGTQGGTYACKELVIAYAAWISPAFHLTVLRAFLDQAENSQNQPQIAPLVEPTYTLELKEEEIRQLAWLHYSHRRMMSLLGWIAKGLEVIGSKFAAEAYGCSTEYRRQSDKTKPVLERLINQIDDKGTRQELTHRLTATV